MTPARRFALTVATIALLGPAVATAQQSQGQAPASASKQIITSHGVGIFEAPKLTGDFAHLPYVNADAPKGGDISIWQPGGFDNYNPFTIKGRAAALSGKPLEAMLESPADEVGSAYCLLCTRIEYPPSRDWVIFHLNPDARFSDNSPLTAHDVLFSFETLRDKGLISFRTVISQMVAKAEVLDAQRIKYYFTPDYPRRSVIQAVGELPVFSRKDFRDNKRDLSQGSDRPFLGSGPYVFDSADIGRSVTWRRNPDYWGKDLPINRGRHNFDKIRIEYFADYESAFEAFKAGEYTFRNEASSLIWSTRYNFPALSRGDVIKAELPNGNVASSQGWLFNLRRPVFQDIRVRHAISLMFNFEWSNDALFYGLYKRVNGFWDNSALSATGLPSAGEKALLEPVAKYFPEGLLTDPVVSAPKSGARQLDRANLRAASDLLNQAGWKTGKDGMRRNAKGQVLRVDFLNDSDSFDRVINPFVQNLRALGIDARNIRVDDSEYEARKRSHDFDLISGHLPQSLIPGGDLQQFFGSASTGDAFNVMGLANPGIDKLIAQVESATSPGQLTTVTHAIDRALRSLRFWVPQFYAPDYNVAYWDMYEHPKTLPPYSLGQLDFWWYNAEKADKLKASGALR